MRDFGRVLIASVSITFFLSAGVAGAQDLQLPATGVWNGFLNHINILECSNLLGEEILLEVTIKETGGRS